MMAPPDKGGIYYKCDSTTDAGERNQLRTGLSHCVLFLQKNFICGGKFHPYAFQVSQNERMELIMNEITLFTDEVVKNMGKRIQDERRKKGFKAIDFADIIGIGKDQLSRIENGKVICKTEYLYVMSQILQVSVDYILFGRQEDDDNNIIYLTPTMSVKKKDKIKKIIKIIDED